MGTAYTKAEVIRFNTVKLLPTEVVLCDDHLDYFRVVELYCRFYGNSKPLYMSYRLLYKYLYLARDFKRSTTILKNERVVQATQWLNRHQVFIPGQVVQLKANRTIGYYIGPDPIHTEFQWVSSGSLGGATKHKTLGLRGCDLDCRAWPDWQNLDITTKPDDN
jgi:hypothetical protein